MSSPEFWPRDARPKRNAQTKTLEELAALYIQTMDLTARSDMILGGWSFGGVLAFEMARQLRRLGRAPKGLILIDSPPPVGHVALPAGVISHITKQSVSGASGATEIAKLARARVASQFQHHAGLLERYAPEPRPGDVPCIMLRCTQTMDTEALCGVPYPWLSDETVRSQFVEEWEGLIGRPVTCYDIGCNHFEVFQGENIEAVSRLLAQACEAIDRMSG